MYAHIPAETADGVGIVTLNRPDKLNAVNRQLRLELHDAVRAMHALPDFITDEGLSA